jgi:benzoyl-CoA reductase/2-hydroxyglutaryl-CoA dehydratase subunit BcrC/BadD/HgdB
VAVVGSTYGRIFALDGLDPDNPIESMARTYTGIFPNRSGDYKTEFLRGEVEKFGVDAVVYHDGRTAQKHSSVRYGLQHRLRQATGLPYLVLEADTHDSRVFSMEQLERQLEDFIELTERQKAAHDDPEGAPGNGQNEPIPPDSGAPKGSGSSSGLLAAPQGGRHV